MLCENSYISFSFVLFLVLLSVILSESQRHKNQHQKEHSMGIFDAVETADVSGHSKYIEPGLQELRVLKVLVKDSKKGLGKMFIVECRVEAISVELLQLEEIPYPVGSTVSWVVKMTGPMWAGNVKNFALAVVGKTMGRVSNDDLETLVGDAQPAEGMVLLCDARHIPTKAGGIFTKVVWSPMKK